MANVIKKTTNRFTKGLVMDFSPENTKNEVLSNALNATLLTFNGNELSLQNDMGNARVETAYLPEGYMPVGTCEYGGIIYIVSYNPLEDKSQIGCFPSPERNISSDELGQNTESLTYLLFLKTIDDNITGGLALTSYSVLLKQDDLNPGDKFIITSNDAIYEEAIKDMYINDTIKENPIIALNIVSIEDSGKIIYLNSDVRLYETTIEGKTYKYNILGSSNTDPSSIKEDIDSYRNTISSGYSVFKSKTSGKLAILAELIMIDSYSVTHSVKAKSGSDTEFDIILHTDVSPKLNAKNYFLEPKLKYYYLSNSQGYMQTVLSNLELKVPLFDKNNSTSNFYNINLTDVYSSNNFKLFNKTLKGISEFKFPLSNTYHGRLISYGELDYSKNDVYTKFFENNYHKINISLIKANSGYFYNTLLATVYKYNTEGSGVEKEYEEETLNSEYTYYVKISNSEYVDAKRNADYRTEILYEIVASSAIATKDIIENNNIEKFLYQQIYYFKKATSEDLTSGKTLYYREDKDGETSYSQLIGELDKNVLYYIYESENILVSIGYEVTTVTSLNIYYYPGTKNYYAVSDDKKDAYYDFANYPMDDSPSLGAPFNLYRKNEIKSFREATIEELLQYTDDPTSIKLYYIENYEKVPKSSIDDDTIGKLDILFIVFPHDEIITKNYFIPSQEFNYIKGTTSTDSYPKNDPIEVLTMADFIPEDGKYDYNDVKLASIKIPNVVIENGLDLPFKYDYTIVPCMNYGRLDHLAVSNTIDFGKLHAFNQSGFHTWKYYVENGLLRLTFGADIYDTYEELKVDGIILEFYDLWGYAGTLEVTDKKSYSGVFTKIIPLNTINVLSNKKIVDNHYSDLEYIRNIEITNNDSTFKYKNFTIKHNEITGWKALSTSEIIDNDCGTLYSNIIYGVKAYFRRKVTDDNYEFIHKKDFFVYTLPIFNDYYNSLLNFDTITNPELTFTLTYKLQDESTKTLLTSGEIVNGYNEEDYNKIANYLNGNYPDNSLEIVKYYNYNGTSKLYLEIGLNEDYKNFNLFNHLDLNKHYSCKLLIVSTNNKTQSFDVKLEDSEITDINYILNYKSDLSNTNSLSFEGGDSYKDLKDISTYNFMGKPNPKPLNITYNFNIGYKASVTNITATQIPATTICALYHIKPDGVYNYEDFGLYEVLLPTEDGEESTYLLYDRMVFTAGHWDKAILGICRQKNITGDLDNLCDDTVSYKTETTYFTKPFALHSGETLKLIVPKLGKLMFGLPHIHGDPSHVYECNLTKNEDGTGDLAIPAAVWGQWHISGHDNDSFANYPMHWYFNSPLYNLLVNTLDSIKYNNEFISALDFDGYIEQQYMDKDGHDHKEGWTDKVWQIKFAGFTGEELVTFSQKLLKSMSSIYAYNPDYDLLNVNTGKVEILKECPVFNSNIINTYSAFDEDIILNDYIYFGGMNVSKYLKNLTIYSGILTIKSNITKKPLDLLNFIANFENCGTEVSPVLLQSLTYKTSIPTELSDDLIFDNSQRVVLKHSDGSILLINGIPNKKTLYGYDPNFNKLVQLDVSNYIINDDGKLELNYLKEDEFPTEGTFINTIKTYDYSKITEEGHKYSVISKYNKARFRGTSITINDLIYEPNIDNHRLYMKNNIYSYTFSNKYYNDHLVENKICYRETDWNIPNRITGYQDYNDLYMATGPCFTLDNL